MASGLPPRSTRRHRNSADTMRRPTKCARDLTTVSTSGSSGNSRNLQKNVFAFDLDFVGGYTALGVVIVCAGAAIKLPQVVWTDHAAIVKLALAQRSAAMDTDAAERAHAAPEVADGVGI